MRLIRVNSRGWGCCGADWSEGLKATERALRAAEIDVCRRKPEKLRAFQAAMEAIKARYRAGYLRREAERRRERERGVPRTLRRIKASPSLIHY